MAKTVTVSVKVADDQFRDFVKRFDELSAKIAGISSKFKKVSETIEDTAKRTQQTASMMRNLLDNLKGIRTTATGITREFGKWTALISGAIQLMGGVGLLGIDKLAKKVMETRRMMMGFGGDTASNQAALRAGSITSTSPQNTMENISMAMHGDIDKQNVFRFFKIDFKNLTAAQNYAELLKKIPEELGKTPGRELQRAQDIGLTKVMSVEEILRLIGEEGKKRRDEILQQMKDKPADTTPEAEKAMRDLHQAIENYRTNLLNRLTELFAPIAVKLTEWVKGMTEIVNTLTSWEAIKNKFAQWNREFNEWLGEDTVWSKFKKLLGEFVSLVNAIINTLRNTLVDQITNLFKALWVKFGLGSPDDGGAGNQGGKDGKSGDNKDPDIPNIPDRTDLPKYTPPPKEKSIFDRMRDLRNKQGSIDGFTQFASAQTNQNFGGGFSNFSPAVNSQMTGIGGTNIGISGNNNIAMWSGVARNATPGIDIRGAAFGGSVFAQNNFTDNRNSGKNSGVSPWQMNRTASLRVDTVPGANIFMQGVSMAG